MSEIRQENEFNEIDLSQFKTKLAKLVEELDQPINASIQQDSSSFINKISVIVSAGKDIKYIFEWGCSPFKGKDDIFFKAFTKTECGKIFSFYGLIFRE